MPGESIPVARLTDSQIEALLVPHEIVRDPVHQDISITRLERRIIDTLAFQRLRSLKQLGPTHLVYPGAVHTRFNHSLGVLHCAEQLVQIANRNHAVYAQPALMRVDPYPHLLIRLNALLHDIAHMPFGHTLEDEGNLADPEWKDSQRANHWLGEKSEITTAIQRYLEESAVPANSAQQVVNDIRAYVLHDGDPMVLHYPFVIDLVGNTLCADLLDYLDRDMFFCGLRERSGDRVIKYVAVVRVHQPGAEEPEAKVFRPSEDPSGGKGRLVLLTYRFEREHLAAGASKSVPKFEILSEAIDLLRRRFSLAEKAFFHRTKLAASGMLISAMASSSLKLREIYGISDDEFISRLLADPSPRTQRLAAAYQARGLYKLVYRLYHREERDADPESKVFWREKYPIFRDPNWRRSMEEKLETYAGFPPGSIAIYCPDRAMNLKEFEMLVQSNPGGWLRGSPPASCKWLRPLTCLGHWLAAALPVIHGQ